ncbi:hypothetical protein Tco_0831890 [Tanacetum coccineum]
MASFDYRYAIKECSSCGALYTRNCGCSKGSLEDKILVPVPDSSQRPLIFEITFKECSSCGALHNKSCACSKGGFVGKFVRDPNKTPDSSQRPPHNCPNCGDPVDGLYCRQCALLRKKLREIFDENEFFQDLLNPSESSNDKTNVVNLPQEPFVFNQDPGENSSQSPPHIDHHCCYECGDSLDDIFCQRCTCKSCGNGAHYGYNCPPKVPIISNPEPCNNQTVDELPQTLPSFDPTCYSGDGNSFTYDSTPNFVNDSPNVFNPPPQPQYVPYSCELCGNDAHHGYDCPPQVPFKEEDRRIAEDQAAKDRYWKIPICYDDDEDDTIAILPVSSTKEPVDSLIIEDEHLDTILATESDEVIKSSVENLVPIPTFKDHYEIVVDSNDNSSLSDDDSYEDIEYVDASPPDAEIVSSEVVEIVIPEVGGIDDDILLTIKDDILREKLLNVNLLIANIEALKDNPVPSSDFVTKSPSTFPNSFLEKTNTFDNSLTESETFCFDLEENSSGSTTTRFDYSLPDYEAFYLDDDHIEEKSSGSTTTHADFSQYDSFIFDLSIDSFPPADRSDLYHEEFAGELAHIISPPEYDHFCFKIEPELGNLTMDVVGDIFPTREPRVHVPNVLPTHPTLNLDFILLSEPLFAYIVWIFLPFLTYPVTPPYFLSCGNEDTIFDPGISIYHSFIPGVSHRSGTFMKFSICFPMDNLIRGRDCPDFEGSRAHGLSICSSFISPASLRESDS